MIDHRSTIIYISFLSIHRCQQKAKHQLLSRESYACSKLDYVLFQVLFDSKCHLDWLYLVEWLFSSLRALVTLWWDELLVPWRILLCRTQSMHWWLVCGFSYKVEQYAHRRDVLSSWRRRLSLKGATGCFCRGGNVRYIASYEPLSIEEKARRKLKTVLL